MMINTLIHLLCCFVKKNVFIKQSKSKNKNKKTRGPDGPEALT